MEKIQKYDISLINYTLYSLVYMILAWQNHSFAATESLNQVENKVRQFILNEYQMDKPKITIQSIDNRLKLAKCGQPLLVNWHHQAKVGRNVIKVQCNSKIQWKIYVPVTIEVFKYVYIATAEIRKGETISALNTKKKRLDIGKLHKGYIEDITLYDEKKTRRNIRQGEALNSQIFEITHAVKRGQSIILETGNQFISVKTQGTALHSGQKGDVIKVRNNTSSIIVEAVIKEKGKATVIY